MEERTKAQLVEELVLKCLTETRLAHEAPYDTEKAERTAAMFLEARMELASFIRDAQLRAKQLDLEAERVEGERYLHYKKESLEYKVTEPALKHLVSRDDQVFAAKKEAASAEADFSKWRYLIESLKDGHYFFKSIGNKDG